MTNIENRMKMSLNTYMVQKDDTNQIIRRLKVPTPCGAPQNLTPTPDRGVSPARCR